MSPGCASLKDQLSGENSRWGSATVEILNSSGAGGVKGDWGLPSAYRLATDKEPSIVAPNRKGTAWLNMGFDSQFWHLAELAPSDTPLQRMSFSTSELRGCACSQLHVCNLH